MFPARRKGSIPHFTFALALDSIMDGGVGFHRFPDHLRSILIDLHDVRGWRAGRKLCREETQKPVTVSNSTAVIRTSTPSISQLWIFFLDKCIWFFYIYKYIYVHTHP